MNNKNPLSTSGSNVTHLTKKPSLLRKIINWFSNFIENAE